MRHRLNSYVEKFDNRYGNPAPCVPAQFETVTEHEIVTQRLDSIRSARHTVGFTVAATLRSDALSPSGVPQEPRLELITVRTPTGTVIRRFLLEHDYFSGNRLRLNNVYEQDAGGASLPPYTFTYDAQTFPSRISYAQDHWGYWNGESQNTSLIPSATNQSGQYFTGADRSPDTVKVKVGSLTRITFPTGGYNEFVWEVNDYGGIGSNAAQPYAFGPQQVASVSSSDFQGFNETTFTVGGTAAVPVRFDFTVLPAGCGTQIGCPYVELVGIRTWHESGNESIQLSPATYTLRSYSDLWDGFASISASWRDLAAVDRKTAGGLRVREVRTADGLGNIQVRKFDYTLASNPAKSSGLVNAEPTYHFTFTGIDCGYFSRASQSKMPLGSGAPVTYREVTVLHGASGEYGRSRETFRSIAEAPDGTPLYPPLPYVRTTSFQWKRGQRLDGFDYNGAGQTQRLTRSTYAFQDALPATTRRFRGLSVHPFSTQFGTGGVYNPFEVISVWYYQDSDTTFTYDESGTSSFASARTYSYGNPEHVQLTQTVETNSDGTQRITRMKYPADYASGSGDAEAIAITAMKDGAHMHSPVIERWVSDNVGGSERVVQAELTSFKTYAAGQYLPYQRFAFDSPTPVTNFVPSAVNGSFIKDSRYLRVETATSYDAAGRILGHADGRDNATFHSYGGNINNAFLTNIRRVNGTGGLMQRITYDGLGNLISIRDSLTYRYFTYDTFGRLRQIKNHMGTVVQAFGYTYSRTAPSWTFDPANPNAVIDTTYLEHSPTVREVVRNSYLDGLGRPIQTVIQNGSWYVVTPQQYDAMGREWRKWKPYTRTTPGYDPNFVANATSYYNSYHAAATAPFVETHYTADVLNRVKRVIPEYIGIPDIEYHTYSQDAAAKQTFTEVLDEAGMLTRNYRDVFGNVVKTVLGSGSPMASTTLFSYNVLGLRTQVTDPRGLIITYTYNTRGQQTGRSSPDAGTTSRKYDAANNLRYVQDANQAAAGQVYFTTYDFGDRALTSGQGTATFTSLDPDATSPPALETNTANWLTVRAYDAKPSTASFPWNRFSSQINGVTLSNVYGRLAAVANRSNGAWQVELFSYDADARVQTRHVFTEANGGAGVLDALNTTISYQRDLRDSVTHRVLTVGGNTWYHWYNYGGRGLLNAVWSSTSPTPPATADVTYAYRPSGAVRDRQFAGGPLVTLRYTIREQLERIGTVEGGAEPFAARYAYNPDGTVAQSEFRSDGAPTAQKRYLYDMAYDARKRIAHAQFYNFTGSGWSITNAYTLAGMQYDAAGNLGFLARYRSSASLIDYLTYATAASSNRLNSLTEQAGVSPETWDAEADTFTYDANGNMLTSPEPYAISSAMYDHQNLPLSFTRNGVTTTYRYNAEGQRIGKQVGAGNTELYVLDGRTTLGVFTADAAGNPISSYFNIVAEDVVVGRQTAGVKSYYYRDLLGSTRAVVQNGAIVESYDYDPWGILLEGRILPGPTKEGFTGKERDPETGLDYFGLRYYMPAVGRWTTVDPPADSFPSWSPYNYVLNNPSSLTDQFGLAPDDPPSRIFKAVVWALRLASSLLEPRKVVPDNVVAASPAPLASQEVSDVVRNLAKKVNDSYGASTVNERPPTSPAPQDATVVRTPRSPAASPGRSQVSGVRFIRGTGGRVIGRMPILFLFLDTARQIDQMRNSSRCEQGSQCPGTLIGD